MNIDSFDLLLTGISFASGRRDVNYANYEFLGVNNRFSGIFGYIGDGADVLLSLQGLPTVESWHVIVSGNLAWRGGHSLGSGDAGNLKQWGFISGTVTLKAPMLLYFGGPLNSNVMVHVNDIVTGGPIGVVAHPTARLGKGPHDYDTYK